MEHPIRKQFREDLRLAGLAESSQAAYLEAVDLFFRRTWLKPEEVSEGDFAGYIKFLHESKAARGTFKIARHGIAFFFKNTLDRDWPIFKKSCVRQDRKDFPAPFLATTA
jgi:hypothetical protein